MDTIPDVTAEIKSLSPSALDLLDRELTAALKAIWKAQGKNKRVVTVKDNEPVDGRLTGGIQNERNQ